MMKMKKLTRTALAALFCLIFSFTITSCDSLLEVEPRQDISAEVALSELSGFEALLTAAYDNLQDVSHYGQYFMLYPDALADNITNLPGVTRYRGPVVNAHGAHLNRWAGFYDAINQTNNLITQIGELEIDAAANINQEPQAVKDRIEGEARFLRALNYFDLIRTKAYEPGVIIKGLTEGVVLRTEPTLETEQALEFQARAPVEEVYAQIETDLQAAIDLLDGTEPLWAVNEQFVANKAAAQALLAQVYLYEKRYDEAASMATNAMNTAVSELGSDLNTEDEYVEALSGATHPGGIFVVEMNPNFDGDVTYSNESISALTQPISFNFQVLPTQDLIAAHEEGDVRLDLYSETEDGVDIINKYTEANGEFTDDIVVIRYAEVLLIRAEARAESGDEAGAQADLNKLRTARGLEAIQPSGQNLIDAILHEKRLELAFEGERFFDLKRRGMDIPKPQVAGMGSLPYTNYRILAQLPETQVANNPELCQNPGYGGNVCE